MESTYLPVGGDPHRMGGWECGRGLKEEPMEERVRWYRPGRWLAETTRMAPLSPRVKGQWGGKRAGYVLITHGALELG